jgi:RNA polymerase sigma-70 factor (ECF subfamily)
MARRFEPSPEEADIVSSVLQGEVDRFRLLVQRYQGTVRGICLRLVGNPTEAEDLVQQTFVNAYCRLDSFDQRRAFAPWLFRIAVNNCKDYLKSHQRRERPSHFDVSAADALYTSSPDNPEQANLRQEESRRLSQAVLQLPDKYRVVVVLKDVEGLSYKEMQAVLRLPITTLKIRVVRARARLAALLAPPGESS